MPDLPDAEKLAELIDELEHATGVHTQNRINYEESGRRITDLRREVREWLATYRRETVCGFDLVDFDLVDHRCHLPAGHEGPHA
jgi:hypothetical protein